MSVAATAGSASVSSIYVSPTVPGSFEELQKQVEDLSIAPHERIGRIYARAIQVIDSPEEFKKTADLLRVAAYGIPFAIAFFKSLMQLRAVKVGKENTSGVYFLQDQNDEKRAVFKIGARRASTEILAGKHAELLGLQDHVVPGLFCALKNPPPDTDLVETLWNDLDKEYDETPQYIVGIAEPCVSNPASSSEEAAHLSFAKMLLYSLAAGLGDAKSNGMTEGSYILYDLDDVYPVAIKNVYKDQKDLQKQGIPTTDMQFLDNPLASKPLNAVQIKTLSKIVENWRIFPICEPLSKEPICFADLAAETVKEGANGIDATHCKFSTFREEERLINRNLAIDVARQNTILNERQLAAIVTRMDCLKSFIHAHQTQAQSFAPIDLVYAVDPYYKVYYETIQQAGGDDLFRGHSPHGFIGRFSFDNLKQMFPKTVSTNDLAQTILTRWRSESDAKSSPPVLTRSKSQPL